MESEYQDFLYKTAEAIDAGGGCSQCGDMTGHECICDDDEEEEDELTMICTICLHSLPPSYFQQVGKCVACDDIPITVS